MENDYSKRTIDIVNENANRNKMIIEMDNYVKAQKQEAIIKAENFQDSLKARRALQSKKALTKALAVMGITGILVSGGLAVNKAVDVKNYSDNPPKTVEEIDQEINEDTKSSESYESFLEYNKQLKEKYPDAPDEFTNPTPENYQQYLNAQDGSKGGR